MRGIAARALGSSQVSDWFGPTPSVPIPSRPSPSVAGLILHYDAGALTGLSDGDSVSSMADLSGNSRTMTLTNANWKASDTPASGPAIYGANAGNAYKWEGTLTNFLNGATEAELFVVCKPMAIGDAVAMHAWGTSGQVNHWGYGGGSQLYSDWGSNTRRGPYTLTAATWQLVNIAAGSSWQVWVDGSSAADVSGNTVAFGSATHYVNGGNGTNGGGNYLAELRIYDHVLSAGDRALVTAQLTDKHGL